MWLHFADSMDKMSKLNIVYNLVDAQGILLVVNSGTSSTPTAASTIDASTFVLEVDHFVDTSAIFPGLFIPMKE